MLFYSQQITPLKQLNKQQNLGRMLYGKNLSNTGHPYLEHNSCPSFLRWWIISSLFGLLARMMNVGAREYQNGVWLINTVILWFDTQLIQTISNKIQWLQRSINTEATNCMNIKMVPLKLSCGSNFRLSWRVFFHFNNFLIRHTSKSRTVYKLYILHELFTVFWSSLNGQTCTHKQPASIEDMLSASYGCLLKGATIKPVSSEPLLNSHPLLGSHSPKSWISLIFPIKLL